MKPADKKESRDDDEEAVVDDDGVEMEVEGEAEGSVVELDKKKNERKDRPHTGRGNPEK